MLYKQTAKEGGHNIQSDATIDVRQNANWMANAYSSPYKTALQTTNDIYHLYFT